MLYLWTYMRGLGYGLRRNDEGATMVEYGLLVAVIAIVVVVGAALLGHNLLNLFNRTANEVANH